MKFNIKKLAYFLFLSLMGIQAFSQGKLMLVGGSSETDGGWSDIPYQWVVQNAANKKVAVITYESAPTQWIPDYFKKLGAVGAKNFIIDSKTVANQQLLYDELIGYDAVFIKGGDQNLYYHYYKGTKTQEALQYIYDHGGVLAGTSAGAAILAPIIYTAQGTSVDPATSMLNAYTSQITLANDFINTLGNQKKYIYDTHFVQRGRFGRLPAFMAKWYRLTRENTVGVGIDDKTAFCIGSDGIGHVYGTGAVNFFYNKATEANYDTTSIVLRTKSMKLTQLLHGCSINLNTFESEGYTDAIPPIANQENKRLSIFLCGTDYPSEEAYQHFANVHNSSDAILIVTGNDQARANEAKTKFEEKGAGNVQIIQAISAYQNDANVQSKINNAKKIVVIANDYLVLTGFLKGSGNGLALKNKIHEQGMALLFAGDNARFAGKTVVNKYNDAQNYPSYYGNLEFVPGLGLLETTAIMPYAFIGAETYENKVSGLPYAMVIDSLKYGIFITGNSFMEYNFTNQNISYFKNLSGSYPIVLLENNGTKAGIANQGPNTKSRNVAGFESMKLKFLAVSDSVNVGYDVPASIINQEKLNIKVFPNPASDFFEIQGAGGSYSFKISDMSGKTILDGTLKSTEKINIKGLSNGFYVIKINNPKTQSQYSTKLCVVR